MDREFKVKVLPDCTVGQLMYKIRLYLNVNPSEALFLFFQYDGLFRTTEELHATSRTLGQIRNANRMEVQRVRVLRENCFGSLDRRFIKAEITQMTNANAWRLKCFYSFYNLYEFVESFVYATQQACERKLLAERCHGYLSIKGKDGQPIDIEPAE
tara:strand:+ start:288 stop:755 length:468 start_codon:yes stop_codon:yes gene_type:complete